MAGGGTETGRTETSGPSGNSYGIEAPVHPLELAPLVILGLVGREETELTLAGKFLESKGSGKRSPHPFGTIGILERAIPEMPVITNLASRPIPSGLACRYGLLLRVRCFPELIKSLAYPLIVTAKSRDRCSFSALQGKRSIAKTFENVAHSRDRTIPPCKLVGSTGKFFEAGHVVHTHLPPASTPAQKHFIDIPITYSTYRCRSYREKNVQF
jgi:hypothetical protein